jgi:hypothetical protein
MSGPEKELPVSQSHLKTPQETKCSRILAFFFFIAGGARGRQYHLDRKDVRTVRFNTGRAPFKARAAESSGMKLLEPSGFSHGEVQHLVL